MNKRLLLAAAWLLTTACWAQQVKVEFMTPSIVHIVKGEATTVGVGVTFLSKAVIKLPF